MGLVASAGKLVVENPSASIAAASAAASAAPDIINSAKSMLNYIPHKENAICNCNSSGCKDGMCINCHKKCKKEETTIDIIPSAIHFGSKRNKRKSKKAPNAPKAAKKSRKSRKSTKRIHKNSLISFIQ